MKQFKFFIFVIIFITSFSLSLTANYTVLYKWKVLDFAMSSTMRTKLLQTGAYIPKNCVIGSVKAYGDHIYIPVVRYLRGVPATLTIAKYDLSSTETVDGFLLQPFPSWEMQTIGNCTAFQSVTTVEIDQFRRLWVLDQGSLYTLTNSRNTTCPAKIVIMDLKKKSIIHTFSFPDTVVSRNKSEFLRFVVSCKTTLNCKVYIGDAKKMQLVVYDRKKDVSFRIQHPSMKPEPKSTEIMIQGKTYPIKVGVDGVFKSHLRGEFERLYYSVLSGTNLYSVSTKDILNAGREGRMDLMESEVTNHGKFKSQFDGCVFDAEENMYYGCLTENSLCKRKVVGKFQSDTEQVYAHSDIDLGWIDSVSFDDKKNLIFTSDKFYIFKSPEGYNISQYNLRIMRSLIT